MADQKQINIRIDGDAAGFNAAVRSAGEKLHEAFEDVGLENIFEEADKQFDDLAEKAKYVKEKLEEAKKTAKDNIDVTGATNDYGRNKIRTDGETKVDKNFDELNKHFEEFIKALKAAQRENKGKAEPGGYNPMQGYEKYREHMTPEQYGEWRTRQQAMNAKRMLGSLEEKDKPHIMSRMFAQGVKGDMQGAITTGAGGEDGLLAKTGMGATATLAAGAAITAVVAGLATAINYGLQQGRVEGKANASFNLANSGFTGDYNDQATGLDKTELLQYGTRTAKSRGFAGSGLADATRMRAFMQGAYGVGEGDIAGIDKFSKYTTGGQGVDATNVIADILSRSQKDGVLGVSKGDFSRLPEKMESISNILQMQKSSSETVNADLASKMVVGFNKLGGEFSDDRITKIIGGLNEGIKNPQNGGMKAFIYEMIQRANPGMATDILAKQEQGATKENLMAILPTIMQMQQGGFRRQFIHTLGNGQIDWQTANRMDSAGSIAQMIEVINSSTAKGEIDKYKEEAKKRASANQIDWDKLKNTIKDGAIEAGVSLANTLGINGGTKAGDEWKAAWHLCGHPAEFRDRLLPDAMKFNKTK